MDKFSRRFITIVILAALFFSIATPSYAEITKYILESENGVFYEYDYKELATSYSANLIGLGSAELYEHFNGILEDGGKYSAVLDDVRGYVDYDDVKQAYTFALISGQDFDLNEYTESEAERKTIVSVKQVEEVDGEIEVEDKTVGDSVTFTFEDLGEAAGVGMTTVKVTVNTDAPEDYEVYVGEKQLTDFGNGIFAGEVPKEDASEDKVYISKKDQNLDTEFQVISIE